MCVYLTVVYVGSGKGFGLSSGRLVWFSVCVSCECECFVLMAGLGLYIVIGGYLRILGTSSVQLSCTSSISATCRVTVYGRYRKSRIVCGLLSDLDLSLHHPIL